MVGGWGFPIDFVSETVLPPSWHPNTLIIELEAPKQEPSGPVTQKIRATSVGGGAIRIDEINGYQVNLSGELHALLVLHHDEIGVIAIVSHILAANHINIAGTSSHRKERGDEALLVVETDGPIPDSLVEQIEKLPAIYRVIRVPAL
jgi:L-serine dehydratase